MSLNLQDRIANFFNRLAGKRGDRPWGYYLVLFVDEGYKVKRFLVHPGQRLSLQRHQKRAEHWHIVQGNAIVTRGDEELPLSAGDNVSIPLGAVHRVQNVGNNDLVIIEVQTGAYVGEDDIERLADDYNRH
ncbi:MAG TPA: phosphomannose isomerase type II C-terminal cupin domain [Candidatus Deferrimicrobiaceae bacterium]|jgi:mannose-6-phosphate isomerase-like protein (cupin superfamily)